MDKKVKFVTMKHQRTGEIMSGVHPDVIKPHEELGWEVFEEAPEQAVPEKKELVEPKKPAAAAAQPKPAVEPASASAAGTGKKSAVKKATLVPAAKAKKHVR